MAFDLLWQPSHCLTCPYHRIIESHPLGVLHSGGYLRRGMPNTSAEISCAEISHDDRKAHMEAEDPREGPRISLSKALDIVVDPARP